MLLLCFCHVDSVSRRGGPRLAHSSPTSGCKSLYQNLPWPRRGRFWRRPRREGEAASKARCAEPEQRRHAAKGAPSLRVAPGIGVCGVGAPRRASRGHMFVAPPCIHPISEATRLTRGFDRGSKYRRSGRGCHGRFAACCVRSSAASWMPVRSGSGHRPERMQAVVGLARRALDRGEMRGLE